MAGGWGLKESKLINRWGEGAQLTKATKKDKRIPGSLTALCVCACSMASMFKYKHFPQCSKCNSCVCDTNRMRALQ